MQWIMQWIMASDTILGPHASRVLTPATNKPARADRTHKSPEATFGAPFSLPPDPSIKRDDRTTVSPLHNSGESADAISLPSEHDPTLDRDYTPAVTRLHNSRRSTATFIPGIPYVKQRDNSANPRLLHSRDNQAERPGEL
jgi:hypothetical protein